MKKNQKQTLLRSYINNELPQTMFEQIQVAITFLMETNNNNNDNKVQEELHG